MRPYYLAPLFLMVFSGCEKAPTPEPDRSSTVVMTAPSETSSDAAFSGAFDMSRVSLVGVVVDGGLQRVLVSIDNQPPQERGVYDSILGAKVVIIGADYLTVDDGAALHRILMRPDFRGSRFLSGREERIQSTPSDPNPLDVRGADTHPDTGGASLAEILEAAASRKPASEKHSD
jgi:hypothetical protein